MSERLQKIGRESYTVSYLGGARMYPRLILPQGSGVKPGDIITVHLAPVRGLYRLSTGDVIIKKVK